MQKSRCRSQNQSRLIDYSVDGKTARTAAALEGVIYRTVANYVQRLRTLLSQPSAEEMALDRAIEMDESYFGGHRQVKRGRGMARKVSVYYMLKRGGRVDTQVTSNTKAPTLFGIMQIRMVPDKIVSTAS